MKYLSILAIYIFAACGLTGCASTDTTASTSSADPVPGQVKSSEERLQPGVGNAGPNASVKW
jgi:hypothetical protein